MKRFVERATGTEVNGRKPWDIQVLDRRFYREVFLKGALGLGDAYVQKFWDVEDLFAFQVRLLTSPFIKKLSGSVWPGDVVSRLKEKLAFVPVRRAKANIRFHYDIGNEFYEIMLGRTMQYSSGYFTEENMSLDDAQIRKFEIVADKLNVFPGCSVLEIGCGWGSFARYLAEEKGCDVTALTLSEKQYRYCMDRNGPVRNGRVRFFLSDFRETEKYLKKPGREQFDRIVGIGTIAHFVPMFSALVNTITSHLKDGGLALIDDVCRDTTCRRFVPSQSAWTRKYIFPGTQFFSPDQITRHFRNKLILEHFSTERSFYRDTCLAWLANIESERDRLVCSGRYDDRFFRIWKYYLSGAAAGFEAGFLGQWQILLSKMKSPYRKKAATI